MKKWMQRILDLKPAAKWGIFGGVLAVIVMLIVILLIMTLAEPSPQPTITSDGTEISYHSLSSDNSKFTELETKVSGKLRAAYTVTFTKNGEKTEPSGTIEFQLPLPKRADRNAILVVVMDAEGNVSYPDFDIKEDGIVFETDVYGVFGIIENESTNSNDDKDSSINIISNISSFFNDSLSSLAGSRPNESQSNGKNSSKNSIQNNSSATVPKLGNGKAEVVNVNGIPTLLVDGQKKTPMMMAQWCYPPSSNDFTRYPNYYQQTADANIHIYQPRVNGGVSISNYSGYFDKILENDPNAMFFVTIWVQSVSDYNFKNRADNVDTTRADAEVCSLGSLEWLDLATKRINGIVQQFMDSKYSKHMLGFMLTAGNTGEWFDYSTYFNPQTFDSCKANQDHFRLWLKKKYGTDAALQKAWGNSGVTLSTAKVPEFVYNGPFLDPVKQKNVIDYMDYHSYSLANAITTLCKEVKKVTNNTKLVGVPYGYLAQLGQYSNNTGSNAMTQVLKSNDLDVIMSPLAYSHRELIDYPGWHGFVDSCRYYGKLWFSEDDTPTYLNTKSAYNWYKHLEGYEESSAGLWKNMMSAVTKRFGFWWYDNYGQGMFDNRSGDTRLVKDLNLMAATAHAAYAKDNWRSATEIAVVLDEKSAFYQTPGGTQNGVSFNEDMSHFMTRFGGIGAPVDMISTADLINGKGMDYKLYFFPQTYAVSDEVVSAINKLKKDNRTLVFLKTPGIIQADKSRVSTKDEVYSLTGIRLELASDNKNQKIGYGSGQVDKVSSLTRRNYSDILTDVFTLKKRPHMYADPSGGYKVLKKSQNSLPIVVKSEKSGWTSYYMDDITLLSTAELRTMCKDAGVFLYTNTDKAVVSADNHFVAVTVDGNGDSVEVNLPSNGTVYEITKDKEYKITNKKLTVSNNAAHTYVFYLGSKSSLNLPK